MPLKKNVFITVLLMSLTQLYSPCAVTVLFAGIPSAFAAEGSSGYGEKRTVQSVEEARKVLTEYFAGKKDVKIGEIRERELYFEADIRDKKDDIIDKVIVDKRTGRIRSTY